MFKLKKIVSLIMICAMVMGMSATAFASNGIDATASTFSSKDKVVKEYITTRSGTLPSDDGLKKVVWSEDEYKIYYENMASGNKRFQYTQYEWEWTGYEKKNGAWVYQTFKSGTTRIHNDPYSFLNSFLFR